MVDTMTPAQRSERMSRIRSGNTKPEIALRRALHQLGFRFRVHGTRLPGKPDIVLAKYKTAIFVHGCFWHRHPGCKVATTPKSNTDFWANKFARNVERDERVVRQLEDDGWRVIIVWECDVDGPSKATSVAARIAMVLRQDVIEGSNSRRAKQG
ncbi:MULTISPECIES: DNA mismatch endonuclease Vsr [unclassified Rhizobium]|uniref:very short patch repair endonuclease n=1 Tax=unclassified Rhizobium TaxID=2613769 RepID=UPI001B330928|nr:MULTISPECIES: DNA mismatch endonuclease Vsr [unclassified Rhizobium]MBX5256889.1 DNA mismatch endonuclease Vsr [Rhizobium sp. NLR16b]MBX5262981.1 DNA mismatch endonuclease Vsr [Rhizobium sp. NLR16a]MBX5311546.1 DNA mismatch endonuclease Vsr [Rhizobium sp. NLR11b]QTU95944.1 DNA mismatch endonuclease Vsr [Rhizobium sp. NLR16a]